MGSTDGVQPDGSSKSNPVLLVKKCDDMFASAKDDADYVYTVHITSGNLQVFIVPQTAA